MKKSQTPLSYEVYQWPEFRAFCKRLGLAWELGTLDLNIDMPFDGVVKIRQSYHGNEDGQAYEERRSLETTTQHDLIATRRLACPAVEEHL